MRKSRFLLNLMVATALGLSTIGCGSSGSGGGPIAGPGPSTQEPPEVSEQRALRQYLLVGQRGITEFAPVYGPGLTAPPGLDLVASPGDGSSAPPAALYEILVEEGSPFRWELTGPGQESPTNPEVANDTPGFHEVHFDPRGEFAIGLSRARNRGYDTDPVVNSVQQTFEVQRAEPLTEQFPPTYELVAPSEPQSIALYQGDQGDFMSGAWSPDGRHFYVSVGERDPLGSASFIVGYTLDRLTGRLEPAGEILFSPAAGNSLNNAAQLMFVGSSQLLALDNANGRLVAYSRDSASGALTELGSVSTPGDPRGMTVDQSGRFLYVVGRQSGALAGYRLGGTAGPEPIEVIEGIGPIPYVMGLPGGDVVASPNSDQLYLGLYNGTLVSYSIDTGTGLLEELGNTRLLGGARNLTNLEVDTTGQFVFAASEHDNEAFQDYVTVGNGFPFDEPPVYANIDETTNGLNPISPTPMLDAHGRVVYITRSSGRAFTGDVQGLRVEAQGTLRAESRVEVENPYGLSIMRQIVVQPVDPETDF